MKTDTSTHSVTQDPPIAPIDNHGNLQWGKYAKAAIIALAEHWPAAFAVHQAQRHPLKIGIANDIKAVAPEISRSVLAYYCHSFGYLQSMASGAVRVDLEGNPTGTVTDEAAAAAINELSKAMMAKAERAAKSAAANRAKQLEPNHKSKDAAASKPKPASKPVRPAPKPTPKPALQSSLTGLREAAQRRRAASEVGRAT